MKKIGLLTLNGNTNYGNRLQNYATQEFLTDLGCEVDTIIYYPFLEKKRKSSLLEKVRNHLQKKDLLQIFRDKTYKLLYAHQIQKRNELIRLREIQFKKFSKTYIRETKYHLDQSFLKNSTLQSKLNLRYDSFFVGSDQVWNLNGEYFPSFYFLPFADKKKRNAFAASFGVSRIDSKYTEQYKTGLKEMNAISVREESGEKIVKELSGEESVLLLDPVFLLSRDEWLELTIGKANVDSKRRYILTYFLGKLTPRYKNILRKFQSELDVEVIRLNDINFKEYFDNSPVQFLKLISSAELVLTDSFHGVAFSIIFGRPFMVVDRIDKMPSMNTRIISILGRFDLSDRYYQGGIVDVDKWMAVDYGNAKKVIKKNKEVAIRFSYDCLS